MKKPKKLLALLLAVVILAGMLPMSALATEDPANTGSPAPVVSVSPDVTEAPAPTEIVTPTEAPAPSETVAPTEAPAPSETVAPTETPAPTETVAPTETPAPSETVAPTETPAPTLDELRAELREMLVQMTQDFFSGDFTKESWEEFQAKLEQGWALLMRGQDGNTNEAPATEEELQNAIATLSLADDALVPLADLELPNLSNPVFTQYAVNTGSIDENEWFLIVNEHSGAQYAMKYDGSALKIPGTSSDWPELITLSGVNIDDYLWHFTKVSGDQYYIQNRNGEYLWNTTTNTAAWGGDATDEVNISTTPNSLGVTSSGNNFFLWKYVSKTGSLGKHYMSLDCQSYGWYENPRFGFVQKDGDELVTSRLYKAEEAEVTYDASPLSVTIKVGENAATAIQNTVVVTKYLNGVSSGSIDYTVDVSGVNNQVAGVYNATISAEGQSWTVVVTVYDPYAPGPQYPDYPNQGSVYINKTATSNRIAVDGTTWVELSVTGVPKKNPVDVVLVVDASASMKTNNRIVIAKEAATNFANILLKKNDDGTKSENRVAVVTFSMIVNSNGTCDFTSDLNSVTSVISSISANGNDPGVSGKGTDYDVAMEQAYSYLSAAQAEEGYNRQQFVVFLSDGAPENGYNGYSSPTYDSLSWNGKLVHEDSTDIKKLGATIYTVGLEISGDRNDPFSASECREILSQYMASPDLDHSGEYLYYDVSQASELTDVFNSIANTIRLAGTDAKVTDIVNPAFELEWDPMDSGTKRTIVYARDGVAVETVTLDGEYKATSDQMSGNIADASGNINAKFFKYEAATQTFTWTLGDITQENITLGYYAYLKGSFDSSTTLTDDVYETNTEATLSYTNYQDQDCEKTFPVPTVPWTGALAHYEFYLTDASGNPVNQAGQVVPFENRITIYHSYVLIQRKDNVIEATTVYAKADIPAGYALVDEDASYYVNPTAYGETAYELHGVGTVLVSPEKGADGKVPDDASFIDSTVAFGVTNTMEMKDRTVVVDYGKPITAIELNEDVDKILGGQIVGFMKGKPDFAKNNGHVYNNKPKDCEATLNGTYGTFSVKDGKAVYTPTTVMGGVETVNVIVESVQREGQGSAGLDTCYMWATLTVIPATNVYYEDTFFTGQQNLVSSGGDAILEQDSYTQGGTYGYDSHYSGIATDNSTMTVDNQNLPGTFTFTFKGTGVDIYSRTDNSSDMVVAQLYQNGEVKQQQLVYAVYETNGGVLYNVPTISFEGLKYDEYTVKLTIPASGKTGRTFYIDGVRVYDPAGKDQTAQNAYVLDGENDSWQVEVRDILLEAESLNKTDNTGNGAVYVDGSEGVEEITTYKDIGPKNETYLKAGNTIGFKLQDDTYTKVLIGAKSADGTPVTLVVNNNEVEINTTTDMYYDITKYIDSTGVVTISAEGSGILSLTKLRMTGVTGEPAITVDESVLEAAGITVSHNDDTWNDIWDGIKELFSWFWN